MERRKKIALELSELVVYCRPVPFDEESEHLLGWWPSQAVTVALQTLLCLDLSRGQVSKSPPYLGALGTSRGYKFSSLSLCCWVLSPPGAAAEGGGWGASCLVTGSCVGALSHWCGAPGKHPLGQSRGCTALVAAPGVRGWC